MWLAGGLVLMIIELVTPSGFFVMFFGFGALTVGVLTRFGWIESAWFEWFLFTGVSVLYVLLFRRRLQYRWQFSPPRDDDEVDSLVGELATPKERIAPNAVGRVELRGTVWSARNDSPATIEPGRRCRVTRVDGLMLVVRPE